MPSVNLESLRRSISISHLTQFIYLLWFKIQKIGKCICINIFYFHFLVEMVSVRNLSIQRHMIIHKNLSMQSFIKNEKFGSAICDSELSLKSFIQDWLSNESGKNTINEYLEDLQDTLLKVSNCDDFESHEHAPLIPILLNQVENMLSTRRRYSEATKKLAFLIFSHSPRTYSALSTVFLLPRAKYVRDMENSLEVNPEKEHNNDKYFRKSLEQTEDLPKNRHVIIGFDEIYCEPALSRVGGSNVGFSSNNPDELARTVLAIMVICPFAKFREVYCYTPISGLSADYLGM